MGMPDRAGFFDAAIEGVGVSIHKGQNGKPDKLQVAIAVHLLAMKNPNPVPAEDEPEWYGVHEQDWHITSYQFLQDNKGNPNPIGLDIIKRVFPEWNGWDFEVLNSMDTSGMSCRVTVYQETYNGKTSFKANVHDAEYTGGSGVKKADPVEIKSINAKFGSAFRALAAPPKPAAPAPNGAPRPVLPPARPSTLPPVQPAAPAQPAEPEAPEGQKEDDLPF